MAPPCPLTSVRPWAASADVQTLQEQVDTLAEINRRLTGESLVLRQRLDALLDERAEQTIARLRENVACLTLENVKLSNQLARQQDEQAQMAARLNEEIRSLQALVAHQHDRLKGAFGAGLFGEPAAKEPAAED